jgi:hypothetical protein
MDTKDLQKRFFNQIKSAIDPRISLVDDVADLLQISNDSAYRRIRGEKSLDLNELELLARRYNISIDALTGNEENTFVFRGSLIDGEKTGLNEYLQRMLHVVENARNSPGKKFFLEAKDILPLHHFIIPELAAFKIFFWSKAMVQDDSARKFRPEDIDPNLIHLAQQISRSYVHVPATEIWNTQTLNSSLRQVDFLWQSGYMESKAQVLHILEKMTSMIDHLEAEAAAGEKYMPGSGATGNQDNFHLYHNEVFMGHNTILTVHDDKMEVYINHNVLNFMLCTNEVFSRYTYRTFQSLIRKSSLISVTNERERARFFNNLRQVLQGDMHKL